MRLVKNILQHNRFLTKCKWNLDFLASLDSAMFYWLPIQTEPHNNRAFRFFLYLIVTVTFIECSHMMTWWKYRCSQTKKQRPYSCTKTVLWELNSIFIQTKFFSFNKLIWLFLMRVKTLYILVFTLTKYSLGLHFPVSL